MKKFLIILLTCIMFTSCLLPYPMFFNSKEATEEVIQKDSIGVSENQL